MIPHTPKSFRLSLSALTIILASLLLAGTLGIVTWRNFDREERLMEDFLRQEGLILIRAIEAGARTSMMMNWQGDSLPTLLREIAREEPIAYIAFTDGFGRVLMATGQLPGEGDLTATAVLTADGPLTRTTHDATGRTVFEVAKEFTPGRTGRGGLERMTERWQRWCDMDCTPGGQEGPQVIFIGLDTTGFAAARAEDVKQGLLMGGLLLLVGSAGFYFLFLSQNNRVARTTLANMEIYTRNVIESMPAGLITLDEHGRIVSLNRKAQEIFGKEELRVEGKPLNDLVGAERCELASLIRDDCEFLERPMECRHPGGNIIPVRVSASRLRGRKGEPLGTVLVLRDMREIHAMEEALERSRRLAALGRMAAGIAHEIRNPLSTLRGFAQFFSRRNGADAVALQYADLMVSEVDRLNRTVSALLQFARPREPEFSSANLGDLLRRTAHLLADEMTAHRVELRLDLPAEPLVFPVDPDLLTQMLINLLQNALAAIEVGGEIHLGADADGQSVRLWVEDTGKGMSAEECERMFEPFYTTRKEGTGLGLAVVQQIIEQHRGRIEVKSKPEQGTTITVILPQKGESP